LFFDKILNSKVKNVIIISCLLIFHAGIIFSNDPDSSRLTIVFAGDIMGHSPQYEAALDTTVNIYNYEPTFRYIKPYIDSADIAIANLEVTLAGPPYSGYPQFSSPDELAFDIKHAGFDIVVMANNHCYDKYRAGFKRTLTVLDSMGIRHLGTYLDSAQRDSTYPLIIEKKGIRIALLNYTYGTNGLVPQKPNIVNYINKKTILNDLAKADSEKVDYKIAIMHWGKEYELQPNKEQLDMARFLVKHGCNAIIGSHPHVVQTFENLTKDTTDSAQNVPVFYSLGNFVSNQRMRSTDGGVMFSLTIEKHNKTCTIGYDYQPYWVYRGYLNKKYQYYVLPLILYNCNPKAFNISEKDAESLKLFEEDTKKRLSNLKTSSFFNCNGDKK
jgi:poly-gamma-glutamate capsule biosynthesis protein CapA/YwtB (metallophosphatase superfamily)